MAAREPRGGGFLDDLLEATLDRAVTLVQVHRVAVAEAEHLNLDVSRLGDVALEIHGTVTERPRRHRLGRLDRLGEVFRLVDAPHADPAASGGSLHQQGEADVARGVLDAGDVARCEARAARKHRHAGCLREESRALLVAHVLDALRVRADPADARGLDCPREVLVLGEEAVAGMDRVGARGPCRCHDLLAEEVAFRGRRAADRHSLVGHLRVHCLGVGLGMHRDRLETEAFARPKDAAGDLAAVGDQDAFHGLS